MGDKDVGLPELGDDGTGQGGGQPLLEKQSGNDSDPKRAAVDLEAVYDVPVTVQAILGKSAMEVSQLLKLGRGTVVGTMLGAILLVLLQNALNQLHVTAYYQYVWTGVLLLVAVALYSVNEYQNAGGQKK